MDLSERSDEDLLSSVTTLVGSHRELTTKLVAHLAEIENRRLHLLAGFSSMFDFCTKKLGFSEAEAFRRILAARLARRFPVVFSLLASGSVNLSTLQLLRESLTEKNHEELFALAAKKSKHEVRLLLAARFPRPDQISTIRRCSPGPNAPSTSPRGASIEPLSESRFKVEFTASNALRQKLELCRDLMSHANPGRDLAVVVERAIDLLLSDLERKRLGKTKRPQQASHTNQANVDRATISKEAKSRRITSATRREVYDRDGLRCTYVAEDGHRCEARAFLELDHVDAKALGGSNHAANLRVRCRAHNQLSAEQTFGRERLESSRNFRQKKCARARGPVTTPGEATAPSESAALTTTTAELGGQEARSALSRTITPERRGAASAATLAKVRSALRNMGFRERQARQAIAMVIDKHDPRVVLPLEQILREAILVATAA